MIEWIEQHYKLVASIMVPIIVAIIGIFKVKKYIKKDNSIEGNNNTINRNSNGLQVVGNNNQVSNFDMKGVQVLAESFNKTMYPHAERCFEKFKLNSQNFLANFNSQLEQLTQSELEKFSEVDVQMALQKAIQGAGRTDSTQIHEILGRLIADRVQKPKRIIAELAINRALA